MPSQAKYAIRQRIQPTVAPLTAAVSLALGATGLQAATITVDTLTDGSVAGQCTLRDAMNAANTDAEIAGCSAGNGADDILFDPSLGGNLSVNSYLPTATSEITVSGPGAGEITITGGGNYRLFSASSAQGSLTVSGLTLAEGYATGVYGGAAAVAINGSELSLSDCVVTDNVSANGSYGGAVLAVYSGLTVDNCTFSNNSFSAVYQREPGEQRGGGGYSSSGGAVLAVASPQVSINNSNFYANQAQFGGAVAFVDCPDTDISASAFGDNYATLGGGVAWIAGSQGSLIDTTLIGNSAWGGGGAAALQNSSITVGNSEFTQNIAYNDGGGLLIGSVYGSAGGPVASGAGDSEQSRGTGMYGPAQAAVTDSLFRLNEADRFGGGAAAKYTDSDLNISNGQIDNNLAGPALPEAFSGSAEAGRSSIISGTTDNAGGGGVGAIYGAYVYLEGNSNVFYNEATQGGGMLAAYGGVAVAAYSDIAANSAVYGGGALAGFIAPSPTSRGGGGGNGGFVVIQDSLVSSNQAALGGGGMSLPESSLLLSDTLISGNQADIGGGALGYGGLLEVKYSEVDGNSAALYGGGVAGFYSGCALNVTFSAMTGNTASQGGGGMAGNCDAYFGYSTVADNQADYAGGLALYGPAGLPPELLNTTITSNTAEIVGGLYTDGLIADFLTVSHNLATGPQPQTAGSGDTGRGVPQSGGAFLDTSGNDVQIENTIFSDNTGPSGPRDLDIGGTGSAVVDYTLIRFPGAGIPVGTGNLLSVDPQLGALENNGGPTATRALASGSPSVDTANPATSVDFDQRGDPFVRQFGGRADMGAFELFVDGIFSDRFEQP